MKNLWSVLSKISLSLMNQCSATSAQHPTQSCFRAMRISWKWKTKMITVLNSEALAQVKSGWLATQLRGCSWCWLLLSEGCNPVAVACSTLYCILLPSVWLHCLLVTQYTWYLSHVLHALQVSIFQPGAKNQELVCFYILRCQKPWFCMVLMSVFFFSRKLCCTYACSVFIWLDWFGCIVFGSNQCNQIECNHCTAVDIGCSTQFKRTLLVQLQPVMSTPANFALTQNSWNEKLTDANKKDIQSQVTRQHNTILLVRNYARSIHQQCSEDIRATSKAKDCSLPFTKLFPQTCF